MRNPQAETLILKLNLERRQIAPITSGTYFPKTAVER